MKRSTPILSHLSTLSDLTRCRILLLLERRELAVSELGEAIGAPQSTTSRHLRSLADEGWVRSRKEGTQRKYMLEPDGLDPDMARLWELLKPKLTADAEAVRDRGRLRDILARRRLRSQEFFAASAGQWDRLRNELFGQGFFLRGLLGLLDPDWTVGDLGCGTGHVAEALAPFVRRVVAVDGAESMVEAARIRLADLDNVDIVKGDLEELPIPDRSLDAATLVVVLHHVAEPGRVLEEACRVLRPGGRLLIVDMVPHDRIDYQEQMGHVWLGFSEEKLQRYLVDAGFQGGRTVRMPAQSGARGPGLFAATAHAGTRETPVRSGAVLATSDTN